MKRTICVMGLGYVGLTSMVGLAELSWAVSGYDVASERVRKLKAGLGSFRDPSMQEALDAHRANGRLAFFESLEAATVDVDIIIVNVPTSARDDGSTDCSAVYDALESIARLKLVSWPTIVVQSLVPPGTCDRLASIVDGWGDLVYAPSFVREGSTLADFLHPDRIVVGSESAAAAVHFVKLFESLQKPVIFTTRASAELIECGSNAFLALKNSFANEIASLCDALSGATSDDVLRGIGYDSRIGSPFLSPGFGFSDRRLESDVKSIEHVAAQHNRGRELLSATLRVNAAQPARMVELVESAAGFLDGLTIGVWGLAGRPGADDARDSLAMRIVDLLADRGAVVVAYDPVVHVTTLPRGARLVPTPLEAADADVLLVLTDSNEFQLIPPHTYAALVRRRIVIDARNALDADRVACAGLTYRGVGRSVSSTAAFPLASAL
jgi:UDPglucose 6-dehydrogenase